MFSIANLPLSFHQLFSSALSMSQKTFRLQGMPQGWTKDDIVILVRKCFQLGNEAVVSVRSLARSVFRKGEDVATLEIRPTPPELADPKVNEWVHTLEGDPPLEVTFDTHFWGLTPLFAPDDLSERTHEYVLHIEALNVVRKLIAIFQYYSDLWAWRSCFWFL